MGFFAKLFGISENDGINTVEEKVSFQEGDKSVILLDSGKSKIMCIKLIRETNSYGLKEAKGLADDGGIIISNISLIDAKKIKENFENVGAVIDIK